MARLSTNENVLELHLQCGQCEKKFSSLLAPGKKDLAITCPFCSNFVLAIIEEFTLKLATKASSRAEDSLYEKRRYRI